MEINEGRHPVIEKVIGHNAYVPNNTYLDESKNENRIYQMYRVKTNGKAANSIEY